MTGVGEPCNLRPVAPPRAPQWVAQAPSPSLVGPCWRVPKPSHRVGHSEILGTAAIQVGWPENQWCQRSLRWAWGFGDKVWDWIEPKVWESDTFKVFRSAINWSFEGSCCQQSDIVCVCVFCLCVCVLRLVSCPNMWHHNKPTAGPEKELCTSYLPSVSMWIYGPTPWPMEFSSITLCKDFDSGKDHITQMWAATGSTTQGKAWCINVFQSTFLGMCTCIQACLLLHTCETLLLLYTVAAGRVSMDLPAWCHFRNLDSYNLYKRGI